MRRLTITNPTPYDVWHRKLVTQQMLNQLEADRLDASREWAEYRADKARYGNTPRVPAAPGYDAAARRLGCEDRHDEDMNARYGEGF